jgi:hypothetical protein
MNAPLASIFCLGALCLRASAAVPPPVTPDVGIYASRPVGCDAGGGHLRSAHYSADVSLGGFGGIGQLDPSSFTVQHGYASQLNDFPLARADALEREPQELTARVSVAQILANDTDLERDALTLNAISERTARGGIATREGQWIRYTPPTGMVEPDWFAYTIADAYGDQATGKVFVFIRQAGAVPGETILHVDGETTKQTGALCLLVQIPVSPLVLLQASQNLQDWRSLLTNTPPFEVAEFIGPKLTSRDFTFYRAVSTTLPGSLSIRLSQPVILTDGSVQLSALSGLRLHTVLESSDNLNQWSPVMIHDGVACALQFVDRPSQQDVIRFYRVLAEP